MKANKGFTLIELAVVLAIIAVLAAILTPMVTSYIDQARTTRAAADVRAMAQAYNLHFRDTGEYPVFETSGDAATNTVVEDFLSTDPTAEPGQEGSVTGWGDNFGGGTSASIDTYLNQNQLILATNNPSGGRTAYRGPYLDLTGASDPWGNAYVATALNLVDNATNLPFILSAGPDGLIDTNADQAATGALTVGNDDVVSRIR